MINVPKVQKPKFLYVDCRYSETFDKDIEQPGVKKLFNGCQLFHVINILLDKELLSFLENALSQNQGKTGVIPVLTMTEPLLRLVFSEN